jgi:ABC-type Zn uptake system ZnuABC Zn-binding protein ZnuA
MKEQGVKVVLVEPWSDQKLASRVAQEAGARAVVMATSVGAAPGTDDYIAMIDFNVRTLAEALR